MAAAQTSPAKKKNDDAADAQTPVPLDAKTVPNDRDLAGATTFAKSYLAAVDDSSKPVSDELIRRQFGDMRQSAMQRGMAPIGDASMVEQTPDGPTAVLLRYTIDVAPSRVGPAADGVDESQAVEPLQSATGEPLRDGDTSARTADGKTVTTTSPATVKEA